MNKLLITTDLHQHLAKWKLLVKTVLAENPDVVLIAGDLLPKHEGISMQRRFFPQLRSLLSTLRSHTRARILLYLSNDDGHLL